MPSEILVKLYIYILDCKISLASFVLKRYTVCTIRASSGYVRTIGDSFCAGTKNRTG